VFLISAALLAVGATAVALHVKAAGSPGSGSLVLHGTDVFNRHNALRAPSFALRDQRGEIIRLSSWRGHILALTFLDSTCTKECPIAGRELARTQRDLGPQSPLTVMVVSVAPTHDTPATVNAYVREVGLTGRWHWLFGTYRRLLPVWETYGIDVQPTQGDIQHTAAVYLVDQRGFVRVADAVPFLPAQLAGSVRALERGA
jgi:cytochrome oxidase Cu insertion factor (SCO1/SenC/PrrC family)